MLLTLLQSVGIIPPTPTPEQLIGPPASTYTNRPKTRQEEYEEYLKEQVKRNNYLIMMLST